ncbi:MAG: Uma2 family endonuclease [Chloroflexi bacterium]|nr:Uma2 family endonuclease [Chloroflexota bacterium]
MAIRKPFGMPVIAARTVTAADYFAMPDTNERYELLEGVLHKMPSPTLEHQRIVGALYVALLGHSARAGGEAALSPLDIELGEKTVLQPDVIYLAPDQSDIARDHIHGAPALIVEVASPGTRKYDVQEKLPAYAFYGVREAWIVDPRRRTVTVHEAADGRWASSRTVPFGEHIPSSIVEVGGGGLGAIS